MRKEIKTELARSPTENKKTVKPNTCKDKRKLVQRFNALFQARRPWERVWKLIRDYELPYDGLFDDDTAGKPVIHDEEIFTGVIQEARDTFAAGVQSGLTPPSRRWFRFGIGNKDLADDTGVQRFLDTRADIMESVLSGSNFYNAIHQCYSELPFGQAALGIFSQGGTVTFVPYTIGTYALACDATGRVSTFARRAKMTVNQIVKQFGYDNCPMTVKQSYDNGSGHQNYHTVCWLVEKNEDNDPNKLNNKKMPFTSTYWVEDSNEDECLAVTGFEEWPVPIARYTVKGTEAYATGPGWNALPDAKMLQQMELDAITAIEMGVKPPLQVPPSQVGNINLFPGGTTAINDPNEVIRPIFQGQLAIGELEGKIQRVEDRVKRTYSSDLFLMLDQLDKGRMTAQEVMARNQEKLQQLGPVVERLQYEFLNRILERVYNILDRSGIFPDIPEELQDIVGEEFRIEYISPLAQAQKMSGLTSIEQGIGFIGQAAQFDQTVLDKVNLTEAVANYLAQVGVPAAMIRSDEEVQEIQKQRQEAQAAAEAQAQQQAAIAQAPDLAAAAKNATEAANDGNPAMQEWLGMR